jgi:hypothetical protein
MIDCVTAVRLREWRGVKPVASPSGVAITTRLRTTPQDEHVLDLVAEHLGGLRRADLARVCHPVRLDPILGDATKRQARRDRLNARKKALTAESSARWANAIIAGNDAQYRLGRDVKHRHIVGLQAAIATIEKRMAQPTGDTSPQINANPAGRPTAEWLPDAGGEVPETTPVTVLASRTRPRDRRQGSRRRTCCAGW